MGPTIILLAGFFTASWMASQDLALRLDERIKRNAQNRMWS